MRYVSTRGDAPILSFDEVLLAGLARDGGLYLPETWPRLTQAQFKAPWKEPDDVVEIGDRRAAIREAIGQAAPGDIVLVAGKGHETGQEVDGVVHPFDDRQVVLDVLTERQTRGA